MRRFLIVSGFLLLGCELVAQVTACYRGDPGYGLCSPSDETCTEPGIVETVARDGAPREGSAAEAGR